MFLRPTDYSVVDIDTQCEGKGGGSHEKSILYMYKELISMNMNK